MRSPIPLKRLALLSMEVQVEPLTTSTTVLAFGQYEDVYHVPDGTSFFDGLTHYIRYNHQRPHQSLDNLYLFAFLRSKLVVNQTTCLMTGNTLPRLQTQDVQKLLIPLPSFDIQEKIADEVMKRQSEAAKLRQEADAIVEAAKREVEQILLEGA